MRAHIDCNLSTRVHLDHNQDFAEISVSDMLHAAEEYFTNPRYMRVRALLVENVHSLFDYVTQQLATRENRPPSFSFSKHRHEASATELASPSARRVQIVPQIIRRVITH